MHAMVINFSGNVGKSTITKYLLAPRLPECKIYSVESINENEHEGDNIRGNALGAILDDMMKYDNALLDVGSSNAETVVSLLAKYDGAHEDFDAFIIPVISKPKVISDSIATASALADMGVPAEKIIIVLNQIDIETDKSIEFAKIHDLDGVTLTYDENLAIPSHDFFARIAGTGFDLLEVLNDETDYTKLVKETPKDSPELGNYVLRRALKRLASSLEKSFSEIYGVFQSKIGAA